MRSWRSGVLLVTVAACVPQGKYDKAVQDGVALQAQLAQEKARVAADDAEVARLDAALKEALARRREADQRLSDALAAGTQMQAALDEATAENAQLRQELGRLGKNADQLISEKGALQSTLADAKARLEELRRAQAAADARAAMFKELALRFHKMIDAGELRIGLRDGRMVLQLSNDVLFDTGRTEIKPPGQAALKEIGAVLRTLPDRRFQVAGHTDNVPIDTARFPSNWELSAGRALEVVHFLVSQGMGPTTVSAAGYGEFDPVASNADAAGRSRNRRTEITLQPRIDELVAVPNDK